MTSNSRAQPSVAYLRSKLYAARETRPRIVTTPVRFDSKNQYPLAEGMLDDSRTQPYIHDCCITVYEGNFVYRYRAFFKRHCLLPVNSAIEGIGSNCVAPFRGDILVMRVSMRDNAYVHFRERDSALANFLVKE